MRHSFKTACSDEVTFRSIDTLSQVSLLDVFEYAMTTASTPLIRQATFDTSDVTTAKARGCERLRDS